MWDASMATLSNLASWRTALILFAIVNLKGLPLAWHIRLFYRMFANWYSQVRVQRALKQYVNANANAASSNDTVPHPLFQPVSIFSRSPLLETDYNLHKSNSTYFADLDEGRTALMTKLLVPGIKQGDKNLAKEGHRGRLSVILGSVHTSFHREIRPYERYEVRSRILGWDKKWIVIGSWFIRPRSRGKGGKEEVLLASALSKYVVKKGRFTVSPERCFTTAGWLPARPDNCQSGAGQTRESSSDDSETPPPPQQQEEEGVESSPSGGSGESSEGASLVSTTPDGIAAPIPESATSAAATVVEKLETAAAANVTTNSNHDRLTEPLLPLTARDKAGEWDWHRIDMERIRGLQIVTNWLALDKELSDEFKRV